MRLIDADVLKPHEQLEPMGNGRYEYVEVVYKNNIDDAPTIEAEPKWIPVSEKLPEKDGRYLVVYWLMKDYMWTDIAWFGNAIMPNRPMQGRYFYISGDGVDVVWDSVLAWMPLPEPWKGGEEE